MSVRSGQSVTVEFITSSFTTGAATSADSLPTGTLAVNGVDNAAAVTVTNIDTGRYKAAVTLPTLAVGDVVELVVAATVGGVAGKGIVWRDTKDVLLDGSGNVTAGTVADKTGYSLSQAFPTNFASLAVTAGGAVTVGTNNDKTGYSLTQAFPTNFSALAITAGGTVTAGTVSDKTGYSLTQNFPANFATLGITAGGHVGNVDTLTTYTGNTPQTGDSYARLGLPAGASVSADVAAVKGDTATIKAKTDSLTFTTPGVVDAGMRYVNGVQVRGTGTTLDPWGPA